MKLNVSYPLVDMLDALSAASDRIADLREIMVAESCYTKPVTVYEPEGMLSTSAFARVTLTHKTGDSRWEGYMETSAYKMDQEFLSQSIAEYIL